MNDPAPRVRPSNEEVARLPAFEGLRLERIHRVRDAAQVDAARAAIAAAGQVGFDTESRPTFRRDEISDGPHVIQFATREQAFIVQVGPAMPQAFLRWVIESPTITKVGFGLRPDHGLLQRKLGMRLAAAVDLAQVLRESGYRQPVGVKAAVAIVLGRRLQKSRAVTTSNWALPELRPNQLLYAANDAYAALEVFHALGLATRGS